MECEELDVLLDEMKREELDILLAEMKRGECVSWDEVKLKLNRVDPVERWWLDA